MELDCRHIILFDLDHTLIRCDSFAGFNRFLMRQGAVRFLASVVTSPVLVPLFLVPGATRRLAGSAFLWLGTVARSQQETSELMGRYFRDRFRDKSLHCSEVVARLHHHVSVGARVYAVTGAPEAAAKLVCAAIGLPMGKVEIVGSTVGPALGGWVGREHCFGRHKVVMLKRRGIDRADFAYTDSSSDFSMLRMAAQKLLVNPSTWTALLAPTALGGGVEIVRC